MLRIKIFALIQRGKPEPFFTKKTTFAAKQAPVFRTFSGHLPN